MKQHLVLAAALTAALFSVPVCHAEEADPIYPPPMPHRENGVQGTLDGSTNVLVEAEHEFLLFTPKDWKAPKSSTTGVVVHFHGAADYAIQEHLRAGLKSPLIAFNGGETSGKYQRPFSDAERLSRVLKLAEAQLGTKIDSLSLSSYGAGYAAIREILKSPQYTPLVKRVVIAGTMYADYAKDEDGAQSRKPVDAQIDPYMTIAEAAARGEKTFVLTFSEVLPGSYAGSAECAGAIVQKAGGSFRDVELDSSPAANVSDFPLIKRFDAKNLHVWGYGGNTPEATITHARHFGDVWKVLNEAGKP